jgi:predicted nucleic acid-binding protein
MPFITLYDTDVLFPNAQRDLLIRIGMSGLVQAKWTEKIIKDLGRALRRAYPEMPEARLERLKVLIYESVPDCLVSDYEPLIDSLKLPDPDDRHVLAAAIKAGAQVIVTNNLRHFPADDLSPWNMEARAADDFVLDQIHINDKVVFACVQQIVDSRHRRPVTMRDVLAELENSGLVQSVAALRTS